MSGFIVGADRSQTTLFPEALDDYVAQSQRIPVGQAITRQRC
jgi:hypothetical protein